MVTDSGARGNVSLDAALSEAEQRFIAANPKSAAQYERATGPLPGGNTRSVLYYRPFPLALSGGEGCRVRDLDGHEYIDFLSEYTAGLYGHSNPLIAKAVHEALDSGIVLGGQNATEAALAEAIVARFPSIERVRFTNSGTEGNLMAIASARAFTGRSKVMVMDGGYHGGVLYFAHGGSPVNAPFDYLLGRFNDPGHCREMIRTHADDLACVIVEPLQGSGGCIPASQEFLACLREETRAAGALLIFDEVMTSRLGPGGLQGLTGIHADLTSVGKYLGGGLTFGAFGGRADILDRFDPRRPDAWPHAGTFNNHVLTMTAGLTGLTRVFTPEEAVRLNAGGDHLRGELNALADKHGLPVQFTGRGSMIGVHFRRGEIRNIEDVDAGRNELRPLLHLDLLSQGIYAAGRGAFLLSLPHGEPEFSALLAAMDEFMQSRHALLAD
jgi:glutamate-1-semialdehyde 2,1-aminomutase